MKTMDDTTANNADTLTPCWFCGRGSSAVCQCERTYCADHAFGGSCLICALGNGLFERAFENETVSGLIRVSLCAAADDPYIVVPPEHASLKPLPLAKTEKLIASVLKIASSSDKDVRERAVSVLAATTNSWPTMNPSALEQHKYGTGLLAADQLRRWLLNMLKHARARTEETLALIILDKLRTADFRDPYPNIEHNLKSLSYSSQLSRVCSVFEALQDFYPSYSHLANEHCELLVYEQYVNRKQGAGGTMERVYGQLLKREPVLARMLKKGTWLSNHARYDDWYYGEEDPA